ncbi:hypothetical protein MGYG_02984 [Nannizzia gypsea CBS 118893]|uniref:Uncharacterized protein n=1 Tax=Arthroderma gypseum (strain ATCC MYA-4604 / CBS 118893) TaxID=535722 RepID=E4UQ57_ARTGP|nr:hypothetical protein MGYG_02984 [Nannizzia gypsea CBS 118893]EFQ99976.1 hypothetical protein MGYG_02984 [Nannizzia gypsea CBS 118893]
MLSVEEGKKKETFREAVDVEYRLASSRLVSSLCATVITEERKKVFVCPYGIFQVVVEPRYMYSLRQYMGNKTESRLQKLPKTKISRVRKLEEKTLPERQKKGQWVDSLSCSNASCLPKPKHPLPGPAVVQLARAWKKRRDVEELKLKSRSRES